MKVNIYQTVHISEEQRKELQSVLTGSPTRKIATRDDIKAWVWQHGSEWDSVLAAQYAALAEQPGDGDSDLLGGEPYRPTPAASEGRYALEDLL